MIILMGIAGSGKGTQGKRLCEQFGLTYVSTGEMLRAHATEAQKTRMHSGELLADDEIVAMVAAVMHEVPDPNKILFDGFPRTIAQAEWLVAEVQKGGYALQVFHLLASREAVKARLVERARTDDHDEAIEERFNEYERSTKPLVDWLKENNISMGEVDAERSVDEIQAELVSLMKRDTV
jgi:adenylate kinase